MIPVLPKIIKDFIEVPLPFLIGVNASPEELKDYPENEGSPVIVMLDKGEVIQNKETKTPELTELRNKLKKCYGKEYMKKHAVKVDYFSTENQAAEICNQIETTLKKTIINKIPLHCDFISEDLDIEKIKLEIKNKTNKADLEFVDKFVETQIFANYAEQCFNS